MKLLDVPEREPSQPKLRARGPVRLPRLGAHRGRRRVALERFCWEAHPEHSKGAALPDLYAPHEHAPCHARTTRTCSLCPMSIRQSNETPSATQLTWARFESAFLERLTWEFRAPSFAVTGTREGQKHRIPVEGSPDGRQVDAAVYRTGDAIPIIVAEVRMHERPLAIGGVDGFVGFLRDIGCKLGVLVSPVGFTREAERRAFKDGIELRLFTPEEALVAELLPVARTVYPMDWAFHPDLSRALLSIQNDHAAEAIDALEAVPFEEWTSFVSHALRKHRNEAIAFLTTVAAAHPDEGWRFNAIDWLASTNELTEELRLGLLEIERDEETIELLRTALTLA